MGGWAIEPQVIKNNKVHKGKLKVIKRNEVLEGKQHIPISFSSWKRPPKGVTTNAGEGGNREGWMED